METLEWVIIHKTPAWAVSVTWLTLQYRVDDKISLYVLFHENLNFNDSKWGIEE